MFQVRERRVNRWSAVAGTIVVGALLLSDVTPRSFSATIGAGGATATISNSGFETTGNSGTGQNRACGVGTDWTTPQQRPTTGWTLVKYDSGSSPPGPGLSYGSTGTSPTTDHSLDTANTGTHSMPFVSAGSSCASTGQATWLGQSGVSVGTSGLGAGTHVQYRVKAKGRSWSLVNLRPAIAHAPNNSTTGPTESTDLTTGSDNTWLDIPADDGTDDGDGLISVWVGARKNGTAGTGA